MPLCTIIYALSSSRTLPVWPALQCMEIFGISVIVLAVNWLYVLCVRCYQGTGSYGIPHSNVTCVFNKNTSRNNCVIRRLHKFLSRIHAPSTVVTLTTSRHRINTIIRIIRLHRRATFGLPTQPHPDPQIKFPYPSLPRRSSFMHKSDDHAWFLDFIVIRKLPNLLFFGRVG